MTNTITLSPLNEENLLHLFQAGFQEEKPLWKNYAAPYFDDYQSYPDFETFKRSQRYKWFQKNSVIGIQVNQQAIGCLSYYWECQATRWLEVGIEIYDPSNWNKGYGTLALQAWIEQLFHDFKDLEHIGLTTWSGNPGMMKTAEKLGMKKEAQIRKVRYWQGHYYDSIKYGVLRKEWSFKNYQ